MFDGLISIFWQLVYEICTILCWLMQCIYETFELFAGVRSVEYQGDETFLLNIFFNNSAISTLYGGMAAIGIVLCFAFCMVAVIRKMFDSEDKMQTTLGAIVGSMIKSILLIFMMNFIMVVVLNSTNILLKQVDYVFGTGSYNSMAGEREITFSEEDYATMARIYNTIGNHALNSSYDSRMNINHCFNEIRKDMLILEEKNVFEFDYNLTQTGEVLENWQSVLVPIARARSLNSDIAIDEYNSKLVDAMVHAMEVLKSGRNFAPLSKYVHPSGTINIGNKTKLDALVMLTGTMSAAANDTYNINPSIIDTLRGPYLSGDKDIYDIDVVMDDFDLSEMDFLLIIIAACFLGYQFIFIAINAIARIFNMILLYLAAPPIIAATPLDGGGKMKQWTLAFTIQSLSIVGALMSMRLVTFFIPIIYDESLIFFPGEENGMRVYIIRLFFVIAVAFTANKAVSMLSGILADSAGWQSINAGNVGDGVVNEFKSGYDNMKSVASLITGGPKQPGGVAAGGAAAGGGGASGDGGGQPENKGSSGEKDSIKPDGLMGMTAQAAKKGMENIKSETGKSPQQNMGGTGSGDEGSQDTGLQQSNQAGMGDTKDESGLGGQNNNADMGNLNNGTGGPGSNGGNTQTNQSNISQTADKNGGNTNNENQASINQTSVNQNNLNQANNNDVNATGNDSVNYGQQMSTDTAQNNTIAQGLGDVSAQQNNVSSMANGLNVDQANMATGNIPNVGGGLNLDPVKTPPNIINYGNK